MGSLDEVNSEKGSIISLIVIDLVRLNGYCSLRDAANIVATPTAAISDQS